ncbi:hypothetical protein L1049_020866 [Liquidambar formosana]|uniref:Uncharacterized protein n=1 Tax=Liquidambar formosana TaxID=63359 RepID=A0AAP0XB08_LIQFO
MAKNLPKKKTDKSPTKSFYESQLCEINEAYNSRKEGVLPKGGCTTRKKGFTACKKYGEWALMTYKRTSMTYSRFEIAHHVVETGEVGKTSVTEDGEIPKAGSGPITATENGLEMKSDLGMQMPNYLDLGDAYKIAVSNRGRNYLVCLQNNGL